MIQKVYSRLIGGCSRPKVETSHSLSTPRGPNRVTNATPTTTVGITKGMVVNARSTLLAGKS